MEGLKYHVLSIYAGGGSVDEFNAALNKAILNGWRVAGDVSCSISCSPSGTIYRYYTILLSKPIEKK